MQRRWLAVLLSFLVTLTLTGQWEQKFTTHGKEGLKESHRLSVLIGHSHISEGIKDNGQRGWKIIPSWGLDYDYWISNQWALGLQNDMMVETFKVEDH